MNKVDFVETMAKESGLTKKDVKSFLDSFINIVATEIETAGNFSLANFGSFKAKDFFTGRRIRFNPAKALRQACTEGEDMEIEAGPELETVTESNYSELKKSRRTWWDIYWV